MPRLSLHAVLPSLLILAAGPHPALGQNDNGFGALATSNPACAEANILAQGIAINIMDQQAELATVNQLGTILNSNPVNMQQFTAAKTNLLSFINNGIAIRQSNQMIMPMGNMATMGLATVANAQLTELGLATNLTGNPTTDKPIVAQLQMDFTGGIQQNMKNQAAALTGCPAMAGSMGTGTGTGTGTGSGTGTPATMSPGTATKAALSKRRARN